MDPITNLVLLPGLDGTEVFFRPFLAALPPSIRPLVVTYPRSGPNDYKTLLQLVLEKVAHLPTFFLLGSSFSGPLAILLAAAHPARLRGLILSATFLRAPKPHLTRYKFAAVPPVIWSLRFARRFPVWLGSPPHRPLPARKIGNMAPGPRPRARPPRPRRPDSGCPRPLARLPSAGALHRL